MKKIYLDITGMGCAACSARIESVLNSKDGISASVNLATNSAEAEFDEAVYSDGDIIGFIKDAGYGASLKEDGTSQPQKKKKLFRLK